MLFGYTKTMYVRLLSPGVSESVNGCMSLWRTWNFSMMYPASDYTGDRHQLLVTRENKVIKENGWLDNPLLRVTNSHNFTDLFTSYSS